MTNVGCASAPLSRLCVFLTCFCFFSWNLQADEAPLITQLKKQMDAGDFQTAYNLATQEFDLHAGKPEFDYLYGLAALQVGKEQEASFAFERVLINVPDHTSAREHFYKLHPEMARFAKTKTIPANYHFLARVGSDSNINDATNNSRPFGFLPLLGNFKLPNDGKKQSDNFFRIIATADWQHNFTANQALFLAAYFEQQENLTSHAFDRNTYSLHGGLNIRKDVYTLRYPVTFEALYYNNQPYRFTTSAGIEYLPNEVWTKTYPFSYFADVGGLRFHRQSYKDVDFVNAGVRWYYSTPFPTTKMITDLYVGMNHNRHHRGRHHGNKYGGFRSRASWEMTPRQNIHLTFGYQQDDYNAPNPLYRKERRDDIFTASLSWEWRFNSSFSWDTCQRSR